MPAENVQKSDHREPVSAPWLKVVERHVASLKFGYVQIVVHDGQVTQIEKTEKLRLNHDNADQFQQINKHNNH